MEQQHTLRTHHLSIHRSTTVNKRRRTSHRQAHLSQQKKSERKDRSFLAFRVFFSHPARSLYSRRSSSLVSACLLSTPCTASRLQASPGRRRDTVLVWLEVVVCVYMRVKGGGACESFVPPTPSLSLFSYTRTYLGPLPGAPPPRARAPTGTWQRARSRPGRRRSRFSSRRGP